MDEQPDAVTELAEAFGIATHYWDWQRRPVTVPESTVVTVLAALGVDASTPDAVEHALAERRLATWRRVLPPVVVATQGRGAHVSVHLPEGARADIEVRCEDGTVRPDLRQLARHVQPVEIDGVPVGEATFELPADLPLGWHEVVLRHEGGTTVAPLAVTPAFLGVPVDGRVWGLMTQLYSVRSGGSWGIGDLHDLAELASWSGEAGAGLLLVNPLHASAPVPPIEPSPYFPATRRFPNPLYLRVEDVPEYAALPADDRAAVDALGAELRDAAGADGLDRDSCWRAKTRALELVHGVPLAADRRRAYEAFAAREGEALDDFATWCALAERHGAHWREWPEPLQDPRSAAVETARDELADRVELHRWLQWLLDEQLAGAQRAATDAGMSLGVVHDLAVGVSPDGADAWAMQDVLALGVTVGAPPDAFNQQGQDWRQPPWHPTRLAEAGYAPYRDMVRALLRHAGGVRVDHVVGLFRLWWIPDGGSPFDGTYVTYDHEAMVGILALEAHRAGAVVVGEDLGTVQPSAREFLAERGILGTSVLWFERDHGASTPLPADRWRELCLATVTTHDLPPTAAYLTGEHVGLRDRLGLLTRSFDEERAADEADRGAWLHALRAADLLGDGATEEDVVAALHAYIARTPARLVGVALTDAVGDRRLQNQPGTVDEYPNWRVPLTGASGAPMSLEELRRSPRARRLLRLVDAMVTR